MDSATGDANQKSIQNQKPANVPEVPVVQEHPTELVVLEELMVTATVVMKATSSCR